MNTANIIQNEGVTVTKGKKQLAEINYIRTSKGLELSIRSEMLENIMRAGSKDMTFTRGETEFYKVRGSFFTDLQIKFPLLVSVEDLHALALSENEINFIFFTAKGISTGKTFLIPTPIGEKQLTKAIDMFESAIKFIYLEYIAEITDKRIMVIKDSEVSV